MRIIGFFLLFALFSSCLKEEIPIPKRETGDVLTSSVDIGGNYLYQAYFDFTTGKVIQKNYRDIWDIAFENGSNGTHILINGAKNMYVYPTDKNNLAEVTNKNGYMEEQRFDSPYGEYDSLAMRNWEDGKVRILNMGYDISNTQQGWYKIKILTVNSTSYTFEFAPLESTSSETVTIEKTEGYNFVFYSLISKTIQNVEPPKDKWDLVFTQFTQRLYQPLVMPYLVTGVLLNRTDIKAKKVMHDFDAIDLEYAQSLTLTDTLNVIGYDWKEYDFDAESYLVYQNVSYVLKNHQGIYYKIRFIDFYGPTGEKGNCKFEYQELGK